MQLFYILFVVDLLSGTLYRNAFQISFPVCSLLFQHWLLYISLGISLRVCGTLRCARKYAAIFRGCFIYCLQFAARLLAHPPPSLSLFAIIFFLAFFYAQLVRFL